MDMKCPSNELLLEFIRDPDAALKSAPGFEEHLEHCSICRSRIDQLANESDPTLWLEVLGDKVAEPWALPQIPGYDIQEKLGQGGFGTVYKAIQVSTGRSVAVKLISRIVPRIAERLHVEHATLLRLDHPHIVPLLDAGNTAAGVYIVYPWMPTNLSTHMKSAEPIELHEVLNVMIPICEAIGHLHSRGIIHRDIKPSNVLLSADLQPKLTDFGLAKDVTNDSASSTLTDPVGTPGYMAPEQTGLVEEQVDFRTDVYGLGALMYAMTVGRPPFQAGNALRVIHQVIHDQPLPLQRLRPDVPVAYDTVCMKCLRKHKAERYGNVDDLLTDLRRLKRGQRVSARPLSVIARAGQWLERRPAVRFGLIAAAVMLVVGGILVFYTQHALAVRAKGELLSWTAERLLTADSNELDKIYDQLADQSDQDLVAALKGTHARDATEALRLSLADPTSTLQWEVLRQGVDACEVSDLPPLRQQLKRGSNQVSLKYQLNEYLKGGQSSESCLRLTAVCPVESLEIDERLCDKLLEAIAGRDQSELTVWKQCLRPYAEELTARLLQKLDAIEQPTQPNYLQAIHLCMLWNGDNPERIVSLLERSTPESITFLKQNAHLLEAQLLAAARKRWEQLLKFEENGWQVNSPTAPLIELSNRYGGTASSHGGVLTIVPASELSTVLSRLEELGCCASSAYRVFDQEFEAYSICFRCLPGRSELTLISTPEEVISSIAQRQIQGWYPASIWVPPWSQDFIVLWCTRQELGGNLAELDASSPFLDSESVAAATEAEKSKLTFAWRHRIFAFQRKLIAPSEVSSETAMAPLATRMRNLPRFRKTNFSRTHVPEALERYVCSDRIRQYCLTTRDVDSFQRKARSIVHLGILPTEVFVDSQYTVRAFCEFDFHQAEVVQQCRAATALVCWLCGDRQPLLTDLHCRPFTHVRGMLIGELWRVSDLGQLQSTLTTVTNPDELNGLLVASARMDWSVKSLPASALEAQTRNLFMHEDSGVHFAARWVLETKLGGTIDSKLLEAREPTFKHRSWFYSKSGIPFIVVFPSEIQVISDDIRTPWSQKVVSNAVTCEHPFAISAVEISQRDVERFQRTVKLPTASGLEEEQASVPMTLISYNDMLRFCRDLSYAEGIDSGILGPPGTDGVTEVVWDEELIKRSGYRLPTGIEWEMACRCGSLTSTFFGENQDYLSDYAWNSDNTQLTTMPVGSLAPSPWGLHDVLGNVYEATLGSYEDHENSLIFHREFVYGFKWDMTINVRGGSFLSNRVYCASGTRHGIPQHSQDRNSGFRIVRPLRVR